MNRLLTLAFTLLALMCAPAHAVPVWLRAAVQVGVANNAIATLTPSDAWNGTPTTGAGVPVTFSTSTTPSPVNGVTASTTYESGDGIAYGQQAITAVGWDPNIGSGNTIPQVTVASTALMSDGDQFKVAGVDNGPSSATIVGGSPVPGSGTTTGFDGNWMLKVVDATHVDLCTYLKPGTGGTTTCVVIPAFYWSAGINPSGYTSGGKIWHNQTVVANWDEHPGAWVEGNAYTVTVMAFSNTRQGIDNVKICLGATSGPSASCTPAITSQTISPTRPGIFGYSAQFTSRTNASPSGAMDGIENAYAVVTPKNGFQRVIGPLSLVLNTNGTIPRTDRYVDNSGSASDASCDGSMASPCRTIDKAICLGIPGGSTAKAKVVINVNYLGPVDQTYQEWSDPGAGASGPNCGKGIANTYPIQIHGVHKPYVTGLRTVSFTGSFVPGPAVLTVSSIVGGGTLTTGQAITPNTAMGATITLGTQQTNSAGTACSTFSGGLCTDKTGVWNIVLTNPGMTSIPAGTSSGGPIAMVATDTATQANSSTGTWYVRALNAAVDNVSFDTEVGTYGTTMGSSSTGQMLFFGPGSSSVAWGGLAKTKLGGRGPAYGYAYPGVGGRIPNFSIYYKDFVGIGESDFDTITAQGFNMYRDVTAKLSFDALQYGLGMGTQTMLTVANYRAQPNLYTNGFRHHNEPTIAVDSISVPCSASAPYQEEITFQTSPYTAESGLFTTGPHGQAPNYMSVITGALSAGSSGPYMQLGTSNTFSLDILPNASGAYADGVTSNSVLKIRTKANANQSLGCPALSHGDQVIVWYGQHGDCGQSINGGPVNEVLLNYECDGDNRQPYLIQGTSGVTGVISTVGNTFTANPVVPLDPTLPISLNMSDAGNPLAGPPGRLITSAHQASANFSMWWASGDPPQIHVVGSSGDKIVPGMDLEPTSNIGHQTTISTQISDASGNLCSSSCTAGGDGVYSIIIVGANMATYTMPNAGLSSTLTRAGTGKGIDYGTLDFAFQSNLTNATVYQSSVARDIAWINTLYGGAYTLADSGLAGQIAEGNRNVFYDFMTNVDPPTQQNATTPQRYAFQPRPDAAQAFYADAFMFRDSLPAVIIQSITVPGGSNAYPLNASHPGVGVFNTEYTQASGSRLIQGATTDLTISYPDSSPTGNPSFLPLGAATVDALAVHRAGWDNFGNPRVAGSCPIGAVCGARPSSANFR